MKCGYIALLPSNNEGRSVLCCDASRLANDDEASRLRCLFYMLRVAQQHSTENAGVSILMIMNKLSFERTKGSLALAEILKVYPIRIASIHVIRQPARLGTSFFDEKVVPSLQSIFHGLSIPIHIHSGTPTCDIRQDLTSYGFDIKNLPRSLGGGWTYEDFLSWRDDQMKIEESNRLNMNPTSTREHLKSSTVSTTPLVNSQISIHRLNSAFPLSLSSTDHSISFPTQSFVAAYGLDQNQLQPSQSLAHTQGLLQFYQNLDLQLLQPNPNYDTQRALQILQQHDQQNMLMSQQRLEHQQLKSGIQQQQLSIQYVGDSGIAVQKTDRTYEFPVATASLVDVRMFPPR